MDDIFTEKGYSVIVDVSCNDEKVDTNFFLDSSEFDYKLILSFFRLVKNEALKENIVEDTDANFENISNVFFKNFNLQSLNKDGSLKDAIKQCIEELGKYNF